MAGLIEVSYSTSSGGRYSPQAQQVRRWMWLPQTCIGLLLLATAFVIGHDHVALMWSGQSARGRIVGFHEEHWRPGGNRMPVTAQMPVVEFSAGGRAVRFNDWLASRTGEYANATVPVLYRATNPTVAMIDRPLWNWIPWGIAAAMGLLLLLSASHGLWLFLRKS